MVDWQTRFAAYVDSCARREFKRGVYDCLIMTNGAVRAIRGTGYADDVSGYADENGRMLSDRKLLIRFGFRSVPDFIDSRLVRIHADIPPRGSLVAIPMTASPYYALGIAFGSGIVTVAEYGTGWVDIEAARIAWAIDPV